MLRQAPEPASGPKLPLLRIQVGGEMEVRPLDANLLRLNDWLMELLGAEGQPGSSAMVRALPLANQLSDSRLPFAPEIQHFFGRTPELHWPELDVRYTARFRCDYRGSVAFLMEPGSLVGDWSLRVNGGDPLGPNDLHPTSAHVRGSLSADITRWLAPGENEIEARVRADGPECGITNPLYLAGDFGVSLSPLGLTERPSRGGFEAYEANGLPFYSGAVEYRPRFELDALPSGEECLIAFEFDAPFRQAATISINGGQARPSLWEPRLLRVPIPELRLGPNNLCIRVLTTLVRAFEGRRFDDVAHCYRQVGE
jgi:hypothetical protein